MRRKRSGHGDDKGNQEEGRVCDRETEVDMWDMMQEEEWENLQKRDVEETKERKEKRRLSKREEEDK